VVIKTNVSGWIQTHPAQIEAAITPRTRAIIITPLQSAGVSYTLKELEALAEVIVGKGS
jgi:aspartate/methionine/tyrosine aminotransferase